MTLVALALALVLGQALAALAQSSPAKSLYERLGRYDALAAAADDFMRRVLAEPRLAPFFAGHSAESRARIRQLMVDHMCAATGGPCLYTGRGMKAAHAGLGITEEQWQVTVGLLTVSLETIKIPSREREELLAALAALKADVVETARPAVNASSLTVEAVQGCLAKTRDTGQCLDELFRDYFRTGSTAEALAAVRGFEASSSGVRLRCHPVVHAIGRQTLVVKGTVQDAFGACDQTCHSGCYHGVLERFLGADAAAGIARGQNRGHIGRADLQARAAAACASPAPFRLRFQCLHGLGHAAMFFSNYGLREALGICDTLADEWSRRSCYGGVFMENLFAADTERRDVKPGDFHYPCSQVDAKYGPDCYLIQTWRMSELGLDQNRMFEECRKAGPNSRECFQSIGRDLSNEARTNDPKLVAQTCELGQGEETRACIRGAAYALIDNTWDGRYALPFCAALRIEGNAVYCFERSVGYLRQTFEKSADDVKFECASRLTFPEACLDAAGS